MKNLIIIIAILVLCLSINACKPRVKNQVVDKKEQRRALISRVVNDTVHIYLDSAEKYTRLSAKYYLSKDTITAIACQMMSRSYLNKTDSIYRIYNLNNWKKAIDPNAPLNR